ncbi:MAG TPA: VWA domain-containing protein [Blastocatellia bacterium]|nr:VWA domain-containing protein [Blastocatellia bacterium]
MKIELIYIAVVCAIAGCSTAPPSGDAGNNPAVVTPVVEKRSDDAPSPDSAAQAAQQENKAAGIYIIFDASGSMMARLPDKSRRIDAAKQVLQDFVAKDFPGYDLALRVYGHRRKEDCADSELLIPFGPPEKVVAQFKESIKRINAIGRTPITYSLAEALKDFGDRPGEIILISDGIESCEADPCALVREWKNKNVKIKVHVVGFGLGEKERQTLECISNAAGTQYHDAQSALTLADEMGKIHKQAQAALAGFWLQGVDAAGSRIRVVGVLSREGRDLYKVTSSSAGRVEAGQYTLTAGVPTANGNMYRPVTKSVQVADTGATVVKVEVPTPPTVRARFTDQGEDQRGSLVHAFQDGKEVFSFRYFDEVFVDEGAYEFRARPNAANDLSTTATIAAGERKEIVFGMAHTVRVTVKMVASGSGIWFRENYELWQNGEKRYRVHMTLGETVLPGVYDVRLPNALTPYVKTGIVVTDQKQQHFDITVPVGHVTFVYQKADGTPDKPDRCFASTANGNERIFRNSNEKYPFTPGRYSVTGWRQKGEYDRIDFEVKEGEDKVVVLRAKR